MQINTKWFGTVEIDDAKVITFEKGLIGFEDCSRYTIVYEAEDKKEKPIMWLQNRHWHCRLLSRNILWMNMHLMLKMNLFISWEKM